MKIVYLSKIPDLFCYSILPILHMCCFPATNSPVGSWGSFGLFLFSSLPYSSCLGATPQNNISIYFLLSFFLLQSCSIPTSPCSHSFESFCFVCVSANESFFCNCFCEKEKNTKQNKWALWNVKEAVKQQSWKRHLNCITNGSSYLIEKQRSRSFFLL